MSRFVVVKSVWAEWRVLDSYTHQVERNFGYYGEADALSYANDLNVIWEAEREAEQKSEIEAESAWLRVAENFGWDDDPRGF